MRDGSQSLKWRYTNIVLLKEALKEAGSDESGHQCALCDQRLFLQWRHTVVALIKTAVDELWVSAGVRLSSFPQHTVSVKYATEHRCGVAVSGPGLSDAITGTDPLKDNLPLQVCQHCHVPTPSSTTTFFSRYHSPCTHLIDLTCMPWGLSVATQNLKCIGSQSLPWACHSP